MRTSVPRASLACFSICVSKYSWNLGLRRTITPAAPRTATLIARKVAVQANFRFHAIATRTVFSESLSQGDVELGRFHSSDGVEVASDIKPDRAYGSPIPQPDAYRVAVVFDEMANVDCAVHVAAVIENR